MTTLTMRVDDVDASVVRKYAKFEGKTISDFIRDAVFEKIEDQEDLAALRAAVVPDTMMPSTKRRCRGGKPSRSGPGLAGEAFEQPLTAMEVTADCSAEGASGTPVDISSFVFMTVMVPAIRRRQSWTHETRTEAQRKRNTLQETIEDNELEHRRGSTR